MEKIMKLVSTGENDSSLTVEGRFGAVIYMHPVPRYADNYEGLVGVSDEVSADWRQEGCAMSKCGAEVSVEAYPTGNKLQKMICGGTIVCLSINCPFDGPTEGDQSPLIPNPPLPTLEAQATVDR